MSQPPARDAVTDLLDAAQRETQDLIGALFQVQMDRVRELLAHDLRDPAARVIGERYSELASSLRPRLARERLDVAGGLAQALNECFARMRSFRSDRDWCDAMLDAAGSVSRRCAFFSVRAGQLSFQGARGLEDNLSRSPAEVPCSAAPAFERVVETSEIQSASGAEELSQAIAAMFEPADALLVPVTAGHRVRGILCAQEIVDPSAIELVAVAAGAMLEQHVPALEPVQSGAGTQADAEAQRFAQVEVAKILLAHVEEISNGRRDGSIYRTLQGPIDAARAKYRSRYPGGRDHLYPELVKTLALGEDQLLGRDYPGPVA